MPTWCSSDWYNPRCRWVGWITWPTCRRSTAAKRLGTVAPAVIELKTLITSAQSEVLLQTPYLVMSDPAQDLFRGAAPTHAAPDVVVSTNSLAATDNAVVYSMSFKYKRRYLREFGFRIYEYKPFPEDAPVDYAALLPEPPLAMQVEAGRNCGEEI